MSTTKITVTATVTYFKRTTAQAKGLSSTDRYKVLKGEEFEGELLGQKANHYYIRLAQPLGAMTEGYFWHLDVGLDQPTQNADLVGTAPINPRELSFNRALLEYLKTLGWDLEHHEHRTRKGEYWVMFGIEDATTTGQPLPKNFWADQYNDRFISAIWVPASNTWTIVQNNGCTVAPGVHYTKKPMNPAGAANLIPNKQFKAWVKGMHGTRAPYDALVQARALEYYRDSNRDGSTAGERLYKTAGNGINIHHGNDGTNIGLYGAGCQVQRFESDHEQTMRYRDSYPARNGLYAYGFIRGAEFYKWWQGGEAPIPKSPAQQAMQQERLAVVQDSVIRQFQGEREFFFRAGLKINADGAYRAYHPKKGMGLDLLANAGKPGNWWGILTNSLGKPIVQDQDDPAPGFYISTTALQDTTEPVGSPERYSESTEIPFIVLPTKQSFGAELGDFCMVWHAKNNKLCGAIYADVGPPNKIGEGSIALALALGVNPDPIKGGVDDGLAYVVFPGSRTPDAAALSFEEIQVKAKQLFNQWGGLTRLRVGIPKLFS